MMHECNMFEKYLKRVEPKNAVGYQASTLTTAPTLQNTHEGGGGRLGRKRSKSRNSAMDRMLRLTSEQKCDIAQREIDECREEIEKLHEDSERVLDTLKVFTFFL